MMIVVEPEREAVVEQHHRRLEEQRQQRRTEHDLGRGERQHQQEVDGLAAAGCGSGRARSR